MTNDFSKEAFKKDIERQRREEEYQKFLAEARRRSAEKNATYIQGLEQGVNESRQRYHQAEREFDESTHERHRIHSTESITATIASFAESLKPIGDMQRWFIEILVKKAWLNVYQTASNSEAWPKVEIGDQEVSLLDLIAEAGRTAPRAINQVIDSCLGTNLEGYFQEPLPPAVIPYLADIDDSGKLTCDFPEHNQLTKELNDDCTKVTYQAYFQDAILRGLKEARDLDGQPIYAVDDGTNIITYAGTQTKLSSEDFNQFRETVLTQKLTQEFGEEFRVAGPAAQRPSAG